MRSVALGPVLILAPIGRDAALTAEVLRGAQIPARICADLSAIRAAISPDVGAILLAEEALAGPEVEPLLASLQSQEPWSDLPVLLLTRGDGTRERRSSAAARLAPATFVTLLERPFSTSTLISSVEAALRARARQWQVRDLFASRNQAIEDLKRTEEELRQKTALLIAVTENAPDPIFAKDRSSKIILANPATLAAIGKTYEQVIGKNEAEWMLENPEAARHLMENDRQVMETGQPFLVEEAVGPRGSERIFLSTKAPLRDDGGEVIGIVGVARDITERKKTELLVRESREQLRLVIETVAAFVVYCDSEERYRFVNRSYATRFSLAPEQMIGRQIGEVIGAEAYALLRDHIATVLRGERTEFEVKLPHDDLGPRWMHCAYVPHQDETGTVRGFVALITDVQERREAEETLREAKLQAEAANAAKDHFLATLSHELRTPLSPVLLCLSDRCNDPALPPSIREDLAMIRRNVELEARLIDDMLDLTRISRGKIELHLETVDLDALLREAINVCTAGDIPREVVFAPSPGAFFVQADRTRLQQVFWNLINNAIKFSPEGSQVLVRTRQPAPGRVRVEVCDSGIGIDPEKIPHLFVAFEQGGRTITKRYGGLGLGLAISQAIVHLHGGVISAESDGRDRGSVFVVELDTCPAPLPEAKPAPLHGESSARALQILLVEDHAATLSVLTRLLKRSGHEVLAASDLKTARERLSGTEFDVLISDLGLPDGSGIDLMRSLSRRPPACIALSGYGMDADVRACLEAGFNSHLTKPVDWQQLSATIEQLVRRSAPLAADSSSCPNLRK